MDDKFSRWCSILVPKFLSLSLEPSDEVMAIRENLDFRWQ